MKTNNLVAVCVSDAVGLINDAYHRCGHSNEAALNHLLVATALLAVKLGVRSKQYSTLVKALCRGPGQEALEFLQFDPMTGKGRVH